MASTMTDLYKILGLERIASCEQIKLAYRKLALLHHPDKGGDAEVFKELARAYQILSDPELRKKYDQSLPLPEMELSPPLKVFADCFQQWLSRYPLVEFLFKDDCHDIMQLLNRHRENPMIKLLFDSLGESSLQTPSSNDLLQTTNFFTAEWFKNLTHIHNTLTQPIRVIKKVYVTLDDIYLGKRYPHQFTITNEDLQLSNDFKIVNDLIQINIPLGHDEIEITTDLHIINRCDHSYYVQNVMVQLLVITRNLPHFCRIGDEGYDLFVEIDLTLHELLDKKVLTIMYLNHKMLRFRNPDNLNLRQLYKIEKIAFPNKELKQRGDLYIKFNLVIHPDQNSMILETTEPCFIYELVPVNPYTLYQTEEITDLPCYSPERLRLTQ